MFSIDAVERSELQRRAQLLLRLSSSKENLLDLHGETLTSVGILDYGKDISIYSIKQSHDEEGIPIVFSVNLSKRKYSIHSTEGHYILENISIIEHDAFINTMNSVIPVFVIVENQKPNSYQLKWGFVHDVQSSNVSLRFDIMKTKGSTPFNLKKTREEGRSFQKTREGQSMFRQAVIERYGVCCAVCDCSTPELLEAAHLCDYSSDGTNDPRNGLILCLNHHEALDRGLYGIDPISMQLSFLKPATTLGITRVSIQHLKNYPHKDAIRWLWNRFKTQDLG